MILALIAIISAVAVLLYTETYPPWPSIASGATICIVFLFVNSAILNLKLEIDREYIKLTFWPWHRRLEWQGCEVQKIVRPIGITAVRIISADGRRLWINSGWFEHFDRLHYEVERRARTNGGRVRLAPR
ncbi:MAG: hypothetical protein GY847_01090 [Proteobacteria bacterium]|nr:hypothetical protein [Pseudomonadota bacterium]